MIAIHKITINSLRPAAILAAHVSRRAGGKGRKIVATSNETVVKRFYEELCNGGHNDIAEELFTERHQFHSPHQRAGEGPQGMVDLVRNYQDGVEEHWRIEALYSAEDT